MPTDKETIKKYYSLLPDEIKAVYSDPQILDDIYDICLEYEVKHLDQIGTIQDAVYDIMLGLLKPADFIRKIIDETGLTEDIANLITHDINEQILRPIHKSIVEHHRNLTGSKDLPANVEREDLGFSSTPYEEKPVIDQEKRDLINEIENPAAATIITRDNFLEKKSGLSFSNQRNNPKPTTDSANQINPSSKNLTDKEPKFDPYRESI